MIGPNTHLFVIDKFNNLFEVYSKDEKVEGENRKYKRKLGKDKPIASYYDEKDRQVIVVYANSITEARNDYHNNFSVNGVYNL